MPRLSDTIPINNELLDRRIKLTKSQKEAIVLIRKEFGTSYQKLANEYKVSKRSIYFICNPDKLKENLVARDKRGGSKAYYNRETHTKSIREHRDYKKELYVKNLITKSNGKN